MSTSSDPRTEDQMQFICQIEPKPTECVLHDFVRDAVSRLSEALSDSTPEFDDDARLERGADGHFREHKKRMRRLAPILRDEWFHSLPDYQTSFKCLESDPVVAQHLNHLVGISTASRRIDAETVLKSLIYAMLDDEGRLAFTNERFHRKWQEWVDFFGTDQIAFKMVAPLPHLLAPAFPLLLDNELALDRLTDDEVTRCYQVGVIRDPSSPRFPPLIFDWVAVGIRRKVFLPKIICDEPRELPNAADEGTFGKRPRLRDDLVVDDILSTMRLFKPTQMRTSGFVSWIDSPRLRDQAGRLAQTERDCYNATVWAAPLLRSTRRRFGWRCGDYRRFDVAGVDWISRMSPWCTVAT